jgi:hypothetical protein
MKLPSTILGLLSVGLCSSGLLTACEGPRDPSDETPEQGTGELEESERNAEQGEQALTSPATSRAAPQARERSATAADGGVDEPESKQDVLPADACPACGMG